MQLTPEQVEGAQFIASRPVSMLADRPGLGKTAQLVYACDLLDARRAIVICPPILRENIEREFEKWSPWGHRVTIIRSGKDKLPDSGIVAVSYNLAVSMAPALKEYRADLLACDEAHALKEPSAARTKAVLGARGIAHSVGRMVWMTGTPAPNHSGELYTFAKACGAWFGNHSAFISAYCNTVSTPYGPKILGNRNVAGLKQMLAPYMIRRTKIEGLPSLRLDTIAAPGDMRAVEAALDQETRDTILSAVETGDYSFSTTPFVSTVRRLAGLAKAPAVAERIEAELTGGEQQIVVFAYHTAVIDIIRNTCAKYGCAVLDGRTPARDRQAHIDAFQAGAARVLICQTQSASEGLTLTAASRVIIAEPSWTPKDNEQMIARCWRRGQLLQVRASFCALPGSIDDTITRALERKARMLAEIL